MVADFFLWWYGAGWRRAGLAVLVRARGVLDTFSVGLLARTLFSPFRQIDAGGVRGPMSVQLQAWFGRVFSRFFGAGLRTVMIFCGLVGAGLSSLFGLVWLVLWPLLPVLPLVGVVAWLIGANA